MSNPRLIRYLFGGACAVVILAGVHAAADLLNPVLMAGFLALLLQPVLDRLKSWGVAAVALIVLAVVLGGLALVGFVGMSARQLALELPRYQATFESLVSTATEELAARNINAAAYIDAALRGPEVRGLVLDFSGALASAMGSFALTVFVFAFMLSGMWEMERRANADAADHSQLAARFLDFSSSIRGYIAVRSVLGLVNAVLNYLVLVLLGIDYALLWGILSFLLSFVPNVGFVLSMVPPMLLGLLEHGWVSALLVFAAYQLSNTVLDNIIGPRFVGRQLKISPLVTFLSVIFWAWVLGPPGAILSVPLTALLRDLASDPDTTSGTPQPTWPESDEIRLA